MKTYKTYCQAHKYDVIVTKLFGSQGMAGIFHPSSFKLSLKPYHLNLCFEAT